MSESFYHKTMKQLLYKFIREKGNANKAIQERYFKEHRADVFLELKGGEIVVIEVQHSPISVKEIIDRTLFYNEKGYYVLWILHAKGQCIEDAKERQNKKKVKISPVEKYLHGMYGGRVYYIDFSKDLKKVTPPFVLFYHLKKRSYKKRRKKGYRTYYLRDQYYSTIPSWSLVCSNFGMYMIARFYDKKYPLRQRK